MPVSPQPLTIFAGIARKFCSWATGEDGSEMSAAKALREVSGLYDAALCLPRPFTKAMGDDVAEVDVPPASLELVSRRAAALPLQIYWEIFDPIQQPPDEPVAGSIADDLVDIYRDVACGLILYDAGDHAVAIWGWGFNFRIHWGEHATGAIRALHAYLARENPDGLSSSTQR